MDWWPDWLDWALIGDAILGSFFLAYLVSGVWEWIDDFRRMPLKERWRRWRGGWYE